jgi:D-arabinitol dehydrogenase (NADP+)
VDREDAAVGLRELRLLAPEGFDVVVDATGAVPVLERAIGLTKIGGTLMVYGMAGAEDQLALSPYEVFRRELTIKGSFAQTHCFDRAIAFLRSGRVRTDGILTHSFDLDGFGDALHALRSDPTCLKSAIVP